MTHYFHISTALLVAVVLPVSGADIKSEGAAKGSEGWFYNKYCTAMQRWVETNSADSGRTGKDLCIAKAWTQQNRYATKIVGSGHPVRAKITVYAIRDWAVLTIYRKNQSTYKKLKIQYIKAGNVFSWVVSIGAPRGNLKWELKSLGGGSHRAVFGVIALAPEP